MATAFQLPHDGADPARPLRIALFSGNYNYVRDGANQALNRLVAFLERQGCTVRVYSPTSDTPAFEPAGTLVSVPSVQIPGRAEYRVALGLPERLKRDIRNFAPDIIHLSAPDPLGHAAKKLGRALGVPVVASVHTRFETYLEYYGFGWLRPAGENMLRRFYAGLDAVFATTSGFAETLREQGIVEHATVWSRGVDKARFNPGRRSAEWRWSLGIKDDEAVIAFVGRLVLEKGLDKVAAAVTELKARGVPHRLLVVGEGPARERFAAQVPDAIFAGFLDGDRLPRAYASAEVLINPSTTETFGNINLEAMASGIPVVAADASGNACLVENGVTGRLVAPDDIAGYADALTLYLTDPAARAAAGAAGLKAAQAYDWDEINGAVLARYRQLV
ncbi:glycosyltransferase family 1 protein [Sandarakinorhabdus sp.]|uniref:glycosyltransferase family 4 protein n=1 Tax=Sandarakinorhabdus sp. TaxID=1916663 RepID=UPI00286DE0E4|nr:glycosyltransferase family 1 protein [Sandarakinorhabdus sp.]